SGATIADGVGIGLINNDDTVPTVSINSVSNFEGNSGKTPYIFTVSLSNPSSQTVTVNFATAAGTATVANNDYQPTSGTVTIPAKTASATVTVSVNGDLIRESDESFFVNLASPTNATIGTGTGTGTILNDDNTVSTLTIADVKNLEG